MRTSWSNLLTSSSVMLRRLGARALTVMISGVLSAFASAAPEPGHFSDPKLSLCVTKALQKAGVTSVVELSALTCNAQGISDAAGINSLTGLQRLSLFGNRLTSIDLSGFEKLENLNLANNALAEIDLSGTKAIQTLYLFGNQLKQLDLEGLEQLVKLKAEKNKILNVKFAGKSALEKVYLFNNEMEDIQIDTLSALKFIDVRSNPMPDKVYDYLDTFSGVKASHDGNTEDWK